MKIGKTIFDKNRDHGTLTIKILMNANLRQVAYEVLFHLLIEVCFEYFLKNGCRFTFVLSVMKHHCFGYKTLPKYIFQRYSLEHPLKKLYHINCISYI